MEKRGADSPCRDLKTHPLSKLYEGTVSGIAELETVTRSRFLLHI